MVWDYVLPVMCIIAFYLVCDRVILNSFILPNLHMINNFFGVRKRQREHPRFYGAKPMPPICSNANVLHLFHGKADGTLMQALVDHSREYTYTMDRSPAKQPDYCLDISVPLSLDQFAAETFDKILIPNCVCCT